VIAYPFITDLEKVLAKYPKETWGKYENRVKIGGVKITIDGSPQGKTAYFTTPYLTGGPGGEKKWSGELAFPEDLITKAVKAVYDMGVPLNLHAKIRPSLYTLHTYYFAEAHIANRGREQALYISPMRDAIDKGLVPTNHTDFVVAPLDQMVMMWSAVNRLSRGGEVIGADQRVTPLEALKAMTINVAQQYGEQSSKGSLEVGKLADLVLLDQNPLKVEPMKIKDVKVIETIKEGKSIYKRSE
jgi:predicted amidohydrolase YtcJ